MQPDLQAGSSFEKTGNANGSGEPSLNASPPKSFRLHRIAVSVQREGCLLYESGAQASPWVQQEK